jgi:hypothetical protein
MVFEDILYPFKWIMGRTAPLSRGSMNLYECQEVAVAAVSASPSK